MARQSAFPGAPRMCSMFRRHLKPGRNELVIEVTNLAANRIADLDRRKVPWKQFHEINFVNIDYKTLRRLRLAAAGIRAARAGKIAGRAVGMMRAFDLDGGRDLLASRL